MSAQAINWIPEKFPRSSSHIPISKIFYFPVAHLYLISNPQTFTQGAEMSNKWI